MAMQKAVEHSWIRFSEYGIGPAPRRFAERSAYSSAVHQHSRLVGRADPVGVRSEERLALFDPICRATQPRVVQRRVEPDEYRVRFVGRAVCGDLETGGLDFHAHARGTENEE